VYYYNSYIYLFDKEERVKSCVTIIIGGILLTILAILLKLPNRSLFVYLLGFIIGMICEAFYKGVKNGQTKDKKYSGRSY
jgi:hypothetical protein